MKKSVALVLVVVALLVGPTVASHAGGGHGGGHGGFHGNCHPGHVHGHGAVFVEVPWWDPLYVYPYAYPYWYYPAPYVGEPAFVAEDSYVQEPQEPPSEPPQAFWYYCASAKAYYPKIKTCPEPWMKIPPPPQ